MTDSTPHDLGNLQLPVSMGKSMGFFGEDFPGKPIHGNPWKNPPGLASGAERQKEAPSSKSEDAGE